MQSKKSFFRIFSSSITGWDPDFVAVSAKLKDFEKLSYVEKLFYVLGNDTLSSNELMEKLHLSHKPTFRHNYLLPALEQNLIEMTIPDKPKSRLQKYRKTNVKAWSWLQTCA